MKNICLQVLLKVHLMKKRLKKDFWLENKEKQISEQKQKNRKAEKEAEKASIAAEKEKMMKEQML